MMILRGGRNISAVDFSGEWGLWKISPKVRQGIGRGGH